MANSNGESPTGDRGGDTETESVDQKHDPAIEDATPGSADDVKSPATPPTTEAKAEQPARLHLVRGTLITLMGALVPFLIMASDRRFSFSVPVGFAGCLIASLGILDLVGSFDKKPEQVALRCELSKVGPRLIELIASGIVLIATLRLAVAGVLPKPILTAALLVTSSFLWMVVALFRVGQSLGIGITDEKGAERGLLERHGFWLVVLNALLYLPLLGSFSLSDPWETHYGEVAREMLARDDWISLWWAQDGWFWSKPILDFWMQGIFFSLLGVRYMPDQMLASAASGRFPQPEWAARLPVFLLTLIGVYFLYKGVARVWGRRAGFLGGLVLTTMPYWYLISHQTMTDMPYVGPLAGAMGLLLLAFHSDADKPLKVYELGIGKRSLRFTALHLLVALILLCVVPQILYLLSRNLTLQLEAKPMGFRPHFDEFFVGSGAGNCSLPGNEACRPDKPVNRVFQPWMAGLLWTAVMGLFIAINRGEQRVRRTLFIAAWFLMALSAMAKGAPGLVLPLFVAGIYVGATKRWRDVPHMELASMLLVVVVVVLPWYVTMHMRHGPPFIDRLLFHDMYKRAFVHVHDTNVGDDTSFRFYIWQLGYGLFPWTGLAAGGLIWWTRRGDESRDSRADVTAFLTLWFVTAFALFTISLTKFHHYIFPAVPPMAMLAGVMLDRMLGDRQLAARQHLAPYLGLTLTSAALLVYGTLRMFPGAISGRVFDGKPPGPSLVLGIVSLVFGVATFVAAAILWGKRVAVAGGGTLEPPSDAGHHPYRAGIRPDSSASTEERFDSALIGALAIASAAVIMLAGRDMFTTVRGDIDGQARLVHLFTYNYRRPWPESLDFNGVLLAFTLASAALCALLAAPRFRTHVTVGLCAVSVLWCAWGVNVYHFKTAPHWGQRETMLAYYKHRAGPQEPLVSYQMNWKGENFYTGNRTPAFVASGQRFKDWIEEQKRQGVRVMYFTTEHGRIGALKGEIGPHKTADVITTPELNNKFMVVRVEF
jgi:4-amino-4-deoxy-L-arabinose transferase-like glycosyltransferase